MGEVKVEAEQQEEVKASEEQAPAPEEVKVEAEQQEGVKASEEQAPVSEDVKVPEEVKQQEEVNPAAAEPVVEEVKTPAQKDAVQEEKAPEAEQEACVTTEEREVARKQHQICC